MIFSPAHAADEIPPFRGGRFALLIQTASAPAADLERARDFARRFGAPDDNVLVLQGRSASGDGLRAAASDLALRVSQADRVMVYFSAQGSRRPDPDRPGACEPVIMAGDQEKLGFSDLAGMFLPVSERVEKTVYLFDTCHSYGGKPGRGNSRCLPPSGGDCRTGNTRWRDFVTEIRKSGVHTANIVAIHASNFEQSTQEEAGGGLFTRTLSQCQQRSSFDTDGSGAISYTELAACAERELERSAPGSGQTPVLSGNRNLVAGLSPEARPVLAGRMLEDAVTGRDGRKEIALNLPRGSDQLTIRAASVGYLYVFAGSGNRLRLIYPGPTDNNRLKLGESFALPLPRDVLAEGGNLLTVVADNERSLTLLPAAIRNGSDVSEPLVRKAFFDFIQTSVRAALPACQATGKQRNLSLWRGCSDAYGAALMPLSR